MFVVSTKLYIRSGKLLEEPGDLILCGAPNHTEYKFPHTVALKWIVWRIRKQTLPPSCCFAQMLSLEHQLGEFLSQAFMSLQTGYVYKARAIIFNIDKIYNGAN